MISSKHINGHIRVKCGGCPERLIWELLSITNTVITAISRTDGSYGSLIIGGSDGKYYNAELLDSIGSLLTDAITDRTSPVWDGIFN